MTTLVAQIWLYGLMPLVLLLAVAWILTGTADLCIALLAAAGLDISRTPTRWRPHGLLCFVGGFGVIIAIGVGMQLAEEDLCGGASGCQAIDRFPVEMAVRSARPAAAVLAAVVLVWQVGIRRGWGWADSTRAGTAGSIDPTDPIDPTEAVQPTV